MCVCVCGVVCGVVCVCVYGVCVRERERERCIRCVCMFSVAAHS